MQIEQRSPLLEEILDEWRDVIGADLTAYKNHVYRMIHFCLALRQCSAEEKEKIVIAGAFHDIGLWSENTVDYLPPSVDEARKYLKRTGRDAWSDEIAAMVDDHHKLTPAENDSPLVELFRKGDLADFSLGMIKSGLGGDVIKAVQNAFPNAGFHAMLVRRATAWFLRHPLNPAPMMKL